MELKNHNIGQYVAIQLNLMTYGVKTHSDNSDKVIKLYGSYKTYYDLAGTFVDCFLPEELVGAWRLKSIKNG